MGGYYTSQTTERFTRGFKCMAAAATAIQIPDIQMYINVVQMMAAGSRGRGWRGILRYIG